MSVNESASPVDGALPAAGIELPDDRYSRLHAHLRHLVDDSDDGVVYVKGKFIADDVDLSSRQIGALLTELKEMNIDIHIEEWSYTGATTWRITESEA